ncbi:MAG: hypothetical protein RMH84_02285 [Sulfolobales archaeon]|nr:hypothetical protein [Sulfolobales archaeon]MCX8208571.1 hypothetical protein [Sulfolobales archaeon]MDW8010406.1 hypothetical protein [Sulfolobales archaeon]
MGGGELSRVARLLKIAKALPLSIPAVVLLVLVLVPAEVPQTILRVAIGVLAVVSCYEVLLHLAGYSRRVEPAIFLKFLPRNPGVLRLLEGASTYFIAWALLKQLEALLGRNYALLAVLAAVVLYVTARTLRSALAKKRFSTRLAIATATVSAIGLAIADSDFKYVESLLKLLEEVARSAL